jgi:hypothetical protein
VAVVHPDLPYLGGDAEVSEDYFDLELTSDDISAALFALPRLPVDIAEYALGLHASALVKDGGCLQIGIGALSDALVKALLLRQQENTTWRRALVALDTLAIHMPLPVGVGRLAPFEHRPVRRQRNGDGRIHAPTARWHSQASQLGQSRPRTGCRSGRLNAETPGGHYLRGAFFLGTRELYDWLGSTEAADPDAIDMCPVSNVNQLYGDHQSLAMLQRRGARFFNTCMMASLLGAATSDTLEDGEVVSGVGGQYNFVAMAHELPDGRSALAAARDAAGERRHREQHPLELRPDHDSPSSS